MSGEKNVSNVNRLHALFLELKASHRQNELRHHALIRALAKNGILIHQEVEDELQILLDASRSRTEDDDLLEGVG